MEPQSNLAPNVIISPTVAEPAHDRHTGRHLRTALLVLGAIIICAGIFLLFRSYKNMREKTFQGWYEQQRLNEMKEMVSQVHSQQAPAPTEQLMEAMTTSASQQPEGVTLEEARALGQQYAAEREAEARQAYKQRD